MSEQSAIFAPDMLGDRVALVTGGGTGLGKATALELARCGARLTIAGRRQDVLEQAAAEIGGLAGGEVHTVVGDVREAEDARQLIGATLAQAGRLDVLVNNAGGQFFSPAELIATKGWRAVWRLNVDGMLNMSEAAYELAFSPAGGSIVNVTLSPHHGLPGMTHSSAARAAVENMTRVLSIEWARFQIKLTAIAAGHFETDALQKYPEPVRANVARTVPLQRLGQPEEHAWLTAFLASPAGDYYSGTVITLDGARDNLLGPWPPPGLMDDAGKPLAEERQKKQQ
jgi:citronellol/citronellal dehydrogenase